MGQSQSNARETRIAPASMESKSIMVGPPTANHTRSDFTNEDAKQHNIKSEKEARSLTPQAVLENLQRGNTRFYMGTAKRPEATAFHRSALLKSQYPSVAVLGCSDSRVPVEMVFDQGLGDVFTIRVAGNYLDISTYGTVEYACAHLKVKVLMVMGHEGCGAIGAACLPVEDINQQPEFLRGLLMDIKKGLDDTKWVHLHDCKARDREAVVCNVNNQLMKLRRNKIIAPMLEDGSLMLVGAFYSMSSGIVDFL